MSKTMKQETQLFKIEMTEIHLFVEAVDMESALKKAAQVAPKIFTNYDVSAIQVVGIYSQYRGVWV